MGLFELFMIGIGLSMDAFAVSICKGLNMTKVNWRNTFIIALFFGGFQAVMPLLGWLLGKQFEQFINGFDHWIAFGLLALLGGKMIYDVIKNGNESTEEGNKPMILDLLIMAVATSIDALAVGVTFAFLKVSILSSISIIGITTFVISLIGVLIGYRFGSKFQSKAELLGGIILVLIGTKILIEHLGLFM